MTILDYAKKLNIKLTPEQTEFLSAWEKCKDKGKECALIASFPRMSGRQLIFNLIQSYRGYMKGRQDAIDERANLLSSICKKYTIPLLDMNCTVDEWEELKENRNE